MRPAGGVQRRTHRTGRQGPRRLREPGQPLRRRFRRHLQRARRRRRRGTHRPAGDVRRPAGTHRRVSAPGTDPVPGVRTVDATVSEVIYAGPTTTHRRAPLRRASRSPPPFSRPARGCRQTCSTARRSRWPGRKKPSINCKSRSSHDIHAPCESVLRSARAPPWSSSLLFELGAVRRRQRRRHRRRWSRCRRSATAKAS